jgi:uncharacterized membrane protein (UPF0127 family)
MLFLFDRPRFLSFWMMNTYLSLDLIFIDADGVVVNVAANAKPQSLEAISSAAPAIAVLEVLAGTAARFKVMAGDRVQHPVFGGKALRNAN